MKNILKIFIISFVILFLTADFTYCQESFYTGVPYYDNNKINLPKQDSIWDSNNQKGYKEDAKPIGISKYSNEDDEEDIYIQKKQKKTLLSFFKKKEEDPAKKIRFNYQTNQEEEIPRGYWGTLPDIASAFKYKSQDMPTTSDIDAIIPKDGEISPEDLLEAPWDDKLFLEEIIKKEEPSLYVKDIQKTKFVLNNLKKCLEENYDMQRYIAIVNTMDLYVKNLKNKYDNKLEKQKLSYNNILSTVYQAKMLGNLMYDSNYYARYTTVNEEKYSKENINIEKQKLLSKIIQTLETIELET